MNNEQKYKEVLERAKQLLKTSVAFDRFTIERIFPELKENEDEKIRKAIIALIEFGLEDKSAIAPGYNVIKEDAIAWLEKQSEKKQTWKPSAAQLIVIKDLIEDKNTSNVNKVILRGMFDELKQNFGL